MLRSIAERLLILFLFSKEEQTMLAQLFACRVILGKTSFDQVPKKLKPQVAKILIEDAGLPELVPTEFGGTADAEAKA